MTTTTGAAPMSAAEVVDTLERCQAYVDDAACFPVQFKPGVVKRDQRQYIEARAVVSAMAEREAALMKRIAELEGFNPSDDLFATWCETHDMHPADRDAFNDAATLYLLRAEARDDR